MATAGIRAALAARVPRPMPKSKPLSRRSAGYGQMQACQNDSLRTEHGVGLEAQTGHVPTCTSSHAAASCFSHPRLETASFVNEHQLTGSSGLSWCELGYALVANSKAPRIASDIELLPLRATDCISLSRDELEATVGKSSAGGAADSSRRCQLPSSSRLLFPIEVVDTHMSPAVEASEKQNQGQDRNDRDEYYVNLGLAIRTLRDELPRLFQQEMTYDIYRDDIVFQDPINTFHGVVNYRRIFSALRLYGRLLFRHLSLEVLRVWQPDSSVIVVRWCVRGAPRLPWESHGRFDGTSEYRLDRHGKIFSHKVDNIAWSEPPRYQPLTVMELLRLAGARPAPTPSITCCCEGRLQDQWRWQALVTMRAVLEGLRRDAASLLMQLTRFSWWRLYLALVTSIRAGRLRQSLPSQ